MFRNLMSTSNRANVTFYTVETSGVKTWGQNAGAADALSGAAGDSSAAMKRSSATERGPREHRRNPGLG